jgi:hypothetical protein
VLVLIALNGVIKQILIQSFYSKRVKLAKEMRYGVECQVKLTHWGCGARPDLTSTTPAGAQITEVADGGGIADIVISEIHVDSGANLLTAPQVVRIFCY